MKSAARWHLTAATHRVRTVCLAMVCALLVACGRESPPAAPLDQPVRVITPKATQKCDTMVATGLVRAAVEVPLSFKTPGVIAQMLVDAGARVQAGQILASLVMTDLDAQRTQVGEQLAKAERDLQRVESLRIKGVISEQAAQDARAQREVALSALAAANFNRQQASISAPAAGLILERRADARETVAAGQPVVIFGRLDRGWVVRAGVAPRDATQLEIGDAVQVRLDSADTNKPLLPAHITRVAAASDARTGSIEVEVALPITPERLVSGMVARLEIDRKKTQYHPSLTLPLSAVLEGNAGHAKIFILDADRKKVKRLDVRTGRLLDGEIEIIEGLPDGATAISEGAAWLNDGDAVRVLQ